MKIGKISSKGQVVIPKPIRDRVGLHAGDSVIFKVDNDAVILEKIREPALSMVDLLRSSKAFSRDHVKQLRGEWD